MPAQGAPDELDLDHTIRSTAHQGYLDIVMRPERRNAVKVLLFFDIGGSMDGHIQASARNCSPPRAPNSRRWNISTSTTAFTNIVWKNNRRRHTERMPTWDVLHKYGSDYKIIFVGDGSMSPYEIAYPGGSVEHWNEEAGAVWLQRVLDIYPHAVWLNPVREAHWGYTHSIQMIQQLFGDRMYPLTLEGLDKAMRELAK